MRISRHALVLAGLLVGCSDQQPKGTYNPQTARSNVVAALPSGWAVTAAPWEQQRFTTAYFTTPRTEEFMLIGPQSNHIDWTDRNGKRHREDVAKECLFVWIVPGDFSPPFPRFDVSFPKLPSRVFSSRGVRVYGYVSHHIADTNRMDRIMKEASMISSPDLRLSWKSWIGDIAAALKK